MELTNTDISDLTALRRDLHRYPEISGEEEGTAHRVAALMETLAPDRILTGLGGHGVAAVFDGAAPGPTVLFRCELDALPIRETGDVAHISEHPGKGHLCGHDGHMAILTGLARLLARQRPARGRVILLYQPAEENGAGAAAVLADARFAEIAPDYAFALHNRPGLPLGHVGLAEGPVNCASRGLKLRLRGKEAHSSEPRNGTSPLQALTELMPALPGLSHGALGDRDFALVTVTHLRMGAPVFGIAPGEADLFATLRTRVDDRMAALCETAEAMAARVAEAQGLTLEIDYEDVFLHCENDPEAVGILRAAMDGLGMSHDKAGCPMAASEDFGRFGHDAKAGMLFLGSGVDHPALHNPDFDFPDDLIPLGVRLFHRVARDMLG